MYYGVNHEWISSFGINPLGFHIKELIMKGFYCFKK